jgi:hypothetical protein
MRIEASTGYFLEQILRPELALEAKKLPTLSFLKAGNRHIPFPVSKWIGNVPRLLYKTCKNARFA